MRWPPSTRTIGARPIRTSIWTSRVATSRPGCSPTSSAGLSDVPLAVLEVECRSAGHDRCRFLLGNGDVMRFLYDRMEQGEGYDAVVGAVV